MERAVAETLDASDAPEAKLRKLYERVQKLRNLSFEAAETEQETRRADRSPNYHVDDVLAHGYGTRRQLDWLFIALARAAGFRADPIVVSSRYKRFFNPAMMNFHDLDLDLVRVTLDGKELFLDPGTRFAPFGLLPWEETGVQGLAFDKDGGTWVTAPLAPTSDSRIERRATLRLTAQGGLEGKVVVTYTGLDALARRLWHRFEDPRERKQFLENELKQAVPTRSDVTLTNLPDWDSSSRRLVAEFAFAAPDLATGTGSRVLLQTGIFGAWDRHSFEHAARVHPVYIYYPNEQIDDVQITLPAELAVANIPPPVDVDQAGVAYTNRVEHTGNTLRLARQLAQRFIFVPVKDYGTVYDFYQQVRAGDGQQIELSRATPAAAD
jgi:hypothetical protein